MSRPTAVFKCSKMAFNTFRSIQFDNSRTLMFLNNCLISLMAELNLMTV